MPSDRQAPKLTPRQLAILAGIANGDTTRIIARQLGIAERTTSKSAHEALVRLGASCREHAVFLAVARSLIVAGPDGRAVPAFVANAPTSDPDLLDLHAALTLGQPIRGSTGRKRAVEILAASGCSPTLIARRLGIARRTVYWHTSTKEAPAA